MRSDAQVSGKGGGGLWVVAWDCISSSLKGLIQLVFNYSLINKSVDLRSLGGGQAHPCTPSLAPPPYVPDCRQNLLSCIMIKYVVSFLYIADLGFNENYGVWFHTILYLVCGNTSGVLYSPSEDQWQWH